MQYPFKNIANRCIRYRWVSEDTEVIKYLDCDMFFTLCLVNDELSFFSNEDDVIQRIQQLSLQFSKSDVYVSPIWAMQSLETGELVFTEKHIEEIFSFMLNKLLPCFDSKNSHIASMIHEIVNCEWCDEECRFPKGANFLREYFMENQISIITHALEEAFNFRLTNISKTYTELGIKLELKIDKVVGVIETILSLTNMYLLLVVCFGENYSEFWGL